MAAYFTWLKQSLELPPFFSLFGANNHRQIMRQWDPVQSPCSYFASVRCHFVSLCCHFASAFSHFMSLFSCFAALGSHFGLLCSSFAAFCTRSVSVNLRLSIVVLHFL